MGENAQKIGKKLEELGVDLLEMFNWNERMRDKEIKCTRKSHKNIQGNSKQTHGVDLYMEYEDPYIGGTQGIFIECKNRQWSGITKSTMEQWVIEEVNLIECAKGNKDLQDFYTDNADHNCALILINCNDDKYDEDKFYEYLSQIQIPTKRIPYKIFIAGNTMINRWDAIVHMIKESYHSGISVLYPSINNSQPMVKKYWSINQLFSKYIFTETVEQVEETGYEGKIIREKKRLVIFNFDIVCAESFQYMWSMCRFFQYENRYNNIDICFWINSKEEHNYVNENFKNIIKKAYQDKIDLALLDSVNIKFLLNRKLNVVDNR